MASTTLLSTLDTEGFVGGLLGSGLLLGNTLGSDDGTLALESERSDQTLDLRTLDTLSTLLGGELTGNDEGTDIIVLGETVHLTDVVGTLRSETERASGGLIGKSGDVVLTLLGDDQVEDRQVRADNATADRLTSALTGTTRAVVRRTLLHQETNTTVGEDTLGHGETLLIVTTSDPVRGKKKEVKA